MNELERQFLHKLGSTKPGRCAYKLTDYNAALPHLQRLIDDGYMIERRLGSYPGFQITDKGREYLGGVVE